MTFLALLPGSALPCCLCVNVLLNYLFYIYFTLNAVLMLKCFEVYQQGDSIWVKDDRYIINYPMCVISTIKIVMLACFLGLLVSA